MERLVRYLIRRWNSRQPCRERLWQAVLTSHANVLVEVREVGARRPQLRSLDGSRTGMASPVRLHKQAMTWRVRRGNGWQLSTGHASTALTLGHMTPTCLTRKAAVDYVVHRSLNRTLGLSITVSSRHDACPFRMVTGSLQTRRARLGKEVVMIHMRGQETGGNSVQALTAHTLGHMTPTCLTRKAAVDHAVHGSRNRTLGLSITVSSKHDACPFRMLIVSLKTRTARLGAGVAMIASAALRPPRQTDGQLDMRPSRR